MQGKERAASDSSKSDAGRKEKPQPLKRLTAAEILGCQDQQTEDVPTPEWGGYVTLRSLSTGEASEYVDLSREHKGKGPLIMLVLSAINDDGTRMFTMEAVEALSKKQMKVISRLQKVALRLNGWEDEDAPIVTEVEKKD